MIFYCLPACDISLTTTVQMPHDRRSTIVQVTNPLDVTLQVMVPSLQAQFFQSPPTEQNSRLPAIQAPNPFVGFLYQARPPPSDPFTAAVFGTTQSGNLNTIGLRQHVPSGSKRVVPRAAEKKRATARQLTESVRRLYIPHRAGETNRLDRT